MDFRSENSAYIDDDGLQSKDPRPPYVTDWRNSGGNAPDMLAARCQLIAKLNDLRTDDQADILDLYKRCLAFGQRGLMKRGPSHPDQDGPDNILGWGVISLRAKLPQIAQDILAYGRARPFKFGPITLYYNYCNVCAENVLHRSSWLGRQQQVIAHLQFAAGEKPPMWRRIWWAWVVATSTRAKPEDQDSWMNSWFLVDVASGSRSWLVRAASAYWRRCVRTRGPGSIKRVVEHYLRPEHPIARYWPDDQA